MFSSNGGVTRPRGKPFRKLLLICRFDSSVSWVLRCEEPVGEGGPRYLLWKIEIGRATIGFMGAKSVGFEGRSGEIE